LIKKVEKWHILNEKHRKQEEIKEEHITKPNYPLWAYVQTVERLSGCTAFAANVVITAENWLLRKT
jgi:hypothetical protein